MHFMNVILILIMAKVYVKYYYFRLFLLIFSLFNGSKIL